MTMKEHLDKLTQVQENGTKLTREEADECKKDLLAEAKAIVTSFVFVSTLLTNALSGIKDHLENERDMCSKCLTIIDKMCNEDVKAE